MMSLAIERARKTMNENIGGPFGALIMKDDKIISVSSNTVLRDNDPTAHAEINAIREACKVLDTYNLEGCELYTTSYPCPMCLSAIMWANIKKVYYGATVEDAEKIGFRDSFIYDYLNKKESSDLELINIDRKECVELFKEYDEKDKTIY